MARDPRIPPPDESPEVGLGMVKANIDKVINEAKKEGDDVDYEEKIAAAFAYLAGRIREFRTAKAKDGGR
jgi:hypothetical protein